MDLFTYEFNPQTITLRNGQMVEGWDSLTWVERYREAGDFVLVSDPAAGLKERLPVGSLVSHIDSDEIMRVENHEISADGDKKTLTITGRSFETFLENRIMGANRVWTFSPPVYVSEIPIAAGFTWFQVRDIINSNVWSTYTVNVKDAIANLGASTTGSFPSTAIAEARTAEMKDLYYVISKLLEEDDLGIRSIRNGSTMLELQIHSGRNMTTVATFSSTYGEIESANYFWTDRRKKNVGLAKGSKVMFLYSLAPETDLQRRHTIFDTSDLDEGITMTAGDDPSAVLYNNLALTPAVISMRTRARILLKGKKYSDVEIISPKIAPNVTRVKYRRDYKVGDIVGVFGEYNTSTTQRVTEYAEIEDENGESGYPTLAAV